MAQQVLMSVGILNGVVTVKIPMSDTNAVIWEKRFICIAKKWITTHRHPNIRNVFSVRQLGYSNLPLVLKFTSVLRKIALNNSTYLAL